MTITFVILLFAYLNDICRARHSVVEERSGNGSLSSSSIKQEDEDKASLDYFQTQDEMEELKRGEKLQFAKAHPENGSFESLDEDDVDDEEKIPSYITAQLRPYVIYPRELHIEWSKPIGKGMYAKCYKGHYINKMIVAKRLHRHVGPHRRPTTNDELIEEAETMLKFSSSHLLPLFGVTWSRNNRFVLLTEYQDHGTLRQMSTKLRQRNRKVPGLKWMHQILGGLYAMHRKGYTHHDILGKNIFINGHDYDAVIADFGLARPLTEKNKLQDIADTMILIEDYQLYFKEDNQQIEARFRKLAQKCGDVEKIRQDRQYCNVRTLRKKVQHLMYDSGRKL